MKKLSIQERTSIVAEIKSGMLTMSKANDMLEILGYGRAIKLADVK